MGKRGPAVKYVVRLDAVERQQLEGIIRTGRGAAYRLLKARILLKADVVLSRFSSGLFRAMFAMKEIWNGNEIHRRVSA